MKDDARFLASTREISAAVLDDLPSGPTAVGVPARIVYSS